MLVQRLGLQGLDPQALLGTGELVAVDVVAQRGEFGGERPDLLPDACQVGLGRPAQRLDALAFGVGGDQ